LNADVGLNETQVSFLSSGGEQAAPLDLDESLVAELAGPSSLDLSGEFPIKYSDDHSASGDFELDAALVAELANGHDVSINSEKDGLSTAESFSDHTEVFNDSLELEHGFTENEALSFDQIEDLTGDFPALREDDDTALSGLDLADIDVSDLLEESGRMPATDADSVPNLQQSRQAASAADDTLRVEAGRKYDQLDIQIDDDVALALDGSLPGEGLTGIDDFKSSGSDISALTEEIDLTVANPPQDFNSSFLDDTFREGESAEVSFVSSEEDSGDDLLDEELILDHASEDEDLPADLDVLALDADFEAFLNKTASVDKIPEIELISDDDDDGPPDLPA